MEVGKNAAGEQKDLLEGSIDQIAARLGVDPRKGLTGEEAQQRLSTQGYNEITEVKTSPIVRLAGKFWGVSAWMLEAVILLSWYLGKYSDMVVVAALLVINALIGFYEERQAEQALEELKSKLRIRARVLRDGSWTAVPARELVSGDTVRVRAGDFVPADIKLTEGEVRVDQSALTGEAAEVTIPVFGNLYSGSVVKRGEANGVVLTTGAATLYGRTTQLVQMAHPGRHIEELISKVVTRLLLVVSLLVTATLVISTFRQLPLVEVLPLALVVMLSAIPVALPVMLTVTTAYGARQLTREGVLVTRLSASQESAMVDVICIDKTGTLTLNKLALTAAIPAAGFDEAAVLKLAALASQAADQDAIDTAVFAAVRERNIAFASCRVLGFTPFSPEARRTEATVEEAGETYRVAKGAVRKILELCQPDAGQQEWAEERVNALAAEGAKVLAVARADKDGKLLLVGLVGLKDVLRPESRRLVAAAKELGIAVKMLTGDAVATAKTVAAQTGIGQAIIPAREVRDLLQSDPQAAARLVDSCDGFAEVYPEDKYMIVQSLQLAGKIVGMTGDGVNDAPALKQAEVGIAVSSATDVAKGAASVVLTGEGLGGIISLIRTGRKVHRRIHIWVLNKISRTVLKSAFVVGTFLFSGKFFISAFAMLLLVFLTDFVKIALATDNVQGTPGPSRLEVAALAKQGTVLGCLMVIEAIGLLYIGMNYLSLAASQTDTFSFAILFFLAIFSLFVVREEGGFWQSRPSNTLGLAIAADVALVAAFALRGLPGLGSITPLQFWVVVLYCMTFGLFANDYVKVKLFGG